MIRPVMFDPKRTALRRASRYGGQPARPSHPTRPAAGGWPASRSSEAQRRSEGWYPGRGSNPGGMFSAAPGFPTRKPFLRGRLPSDWFFIAPQAVAQKCSQNKDFGRGWAGVGRAVPTHRGKFRIPKCRRYGPSSGGVIGSDGGMSSGGRTKRVSCSPGSSAASAATIMRRMTLGTPARGRSGAGGGRECHPPRPRFQTSVGSGRFLETLALPAAGQV